MTSLTMRLPDDFHVHVRTGQMLCNVLPYTAAVTGRGLYMPNTEPPILTGADAALYAVEIIRSNRHPHHTPLLTIKITPATTPAMIREAKQLGVTAGKLYPDGVTTNSEGGVRDITDLLPVFAAMEAVGMVLCIHGELPGAFILERESRYLPTVQGIAQEFPALRIVLEHISTAEACRWLDEIFPSNVAATITAHHLVLTLDDVIGGMLKPHHFCKPVAKTPQDRAALIRAATSGSPKYFFGSDTAPHHVSLKECADGCAGVFTAPVMLPLLADVFDTAGVLARLEGFTSVFGAQFYGLPLNEHWITLDQQPWVVPADYDGVVPLRAGQTLQWQVIETFATAPAASDA